MRSLEGQSSRLVCLRFKVAVVIQQIYFRYVQGQTQDQRFRDFDGMVRELIHQALELAQRSTL